MQLTKIVNTTPEILFDFLAESFVGDYKKNTGHKLDKQAIHPGFNYQTGLGKDDASSALVKVIQFQAPTDYEVEVHTNRGVNSIKYAIEAEGTTQSKVTYAEELTQSDFFNKWNYKLLMPLYKRIFAKRFETQMDYIENKLEV